MPYWYNVRTRQVEPDADPERARSADLLGPYATEAEAANALATAAARTEQWDEEEEAERAWERGDGPAPSGV